MFWRIIGSVVRTAVAVNKTVTALGAATVIMVGVYDYMRNRRRRQ